MTEQNSDVHLALTRLRGLLGDADPERLVYIIHDGAPVSKSRARWHRIKGHFYTPEKTRAGEEALAWQFKASVPDRPWTGNIAIVATFYRPNRQRIDSDNMMKLVMDAATKAGVWEDDSQVTAQASFVELDEQRPRTVIALAPTVSSMNRRELKTFICRRCRREFRRPHWSSQKFCSKECARLSERREVSCPRCDKTFIRRWAGQRYCTPLCAVTAPRKRQPAANQRPPARCETCGERVSRREYKQCANCAPKGRRPGTKNKPKSLPEAAEGRLLA